MKDRIEMLEQTILDLGAEVYRLRHVMVGFTVKQKAVSKLLNGLRDMLDERGIISKEDIEATALINDLVDHNTAISDEDTPEILSGKYEPNH